MSKLILFPSKLILFPLLSMSLDSFFSESFFPLIVNIGVVNNTEHAYFQ